MSEKTKQARSNLVTIYNISGQRATFELDGAIHVLKPRESAKIHEAYTKPRQSVPGRDPVPSIIEMLTDGRVLPETHKKCRQVMGLDVKTPEPNSEEQQLESEQLDQEIADVGQELTE